MNPFKITPKPVLNRRQHPKPTPELRTPRPPIVIPEPTPRVINPPAPVWRPDPKPPKPMMMAATPTLRTVTFDTTPASFGYLQNSTYYSKTNSYFKLASDPSDAEMWSQYPATQNVDFGGFNADNIGQVNAQTVAADSVSANNGNIGDLSTNTIGAATGTITTLSGQSTTMDSVSTNTLTVFGEADVDSLIVGGVTYVPTSSWYTYPTLPVAPATGGVVKFLDASGNHTLAAIDGDLYYDNELLAKAGDIQNVADWSLYPALQAVDMDGQALNNVASVNGESGQSISVTSNGVNVLTAGTTGVAVFNKAPQTATVPAAGNDLTNKTYVDSTAAAAAALWSSYPAGSTVTMSGFGITGAGTVSATQLNLSNTALTNNSGTLTWNGQPITTGGGGSAANWSNYPAISTIDCSGQNILNAGNLTANGATFAGVLKVDDQNIEMLGSGNYLEVGKNNIRVLAPTVGYNDVYLEANLKVGDPGALTGPQIELFPNQFTMGDALHPISGGIYMTAGSLIQFTSPLINMLGANIAVGAGAVEVGAGNITVGTAATAGGGVNVYGGKLFLAPSAIGPPSGGNGGLVVSGTADIQANALHDGDLGYLQIQQKTGSTTTNVVSINNITQLTSAPSTAGMDITNVKTITGNNLAITNVDDISTLTVSLASNPDALNTANGFTTLKSTTGDCVIQATGTVRVEDITGGPAVDGFLFGAELEAGVQVASPLYHINGPTTASYLQSTVDGQVDVTNSAGAYYDLKAKDVILQGSTDMTLAASGTTRVTVNTSNTIAYLSDVPTITKDTTEFWVSAQGSNSNTGSVVAPFQTIQYAITQAEAVSSSSNMAIINVAPGVYAENLSFAKGYVTLATQATNENLAGQVTISGTISVALTGSDDLFGRQVSFIGFQLDGQAGNTHIVNDSSSVSHTLGFQNCYFFQGGASGSAVYVSNTATDQRTYLQNCSVQGTATSTGALLTIGKGFLEIDKCDITTTANIPCILMTGASRIQRAALNSFTNSNASNNLAPLINLNTSGFANSIGNNTFLFTAGTTQNGGTPANICAVFFDASTVTPPAGVSNLIFVFNFLSLLGTLDPTNHAIAKQTAGTTPVVILYNNGSIPGLAYKVEAGITTAACNTVA